MVDYRPLYPDLSEFKEVDRPESKCSQVPGAWDVDRDAVPTPPAEDTAGTESQRKEVNVTARSSDFHSPKHPSSSPSVPVQRGFVSRPPRRKINNHEDFFVSPPLTPTKSVSPEQHPSTPPQTSTSNPQNEAEARIPNSTSPSAVAPAPTLPKRDPPRLVNGAFKGTYTHVNGRMASYKRTRTSAAALIWPPPREKRSRKSEEALVPASSPKRKDESALEQTKGKSDIAPQKRVQLLNKEKSAPLALSVTKAYKRRESAGGRPAMLASVKDETHPELFHPQPEPEPQAGPSRIQASNPPPATVEKAAEIDAWRMKTPASEVPVSSVSTASASDPFVTTNLANRLRKEEKDKKKEKMDASANRRMTFGGFSALPTDIPEIDLRKKRFGRNSLAADPTTLAARRSLSTSNSLFAKQKEHLSSRRTSLASTIDLTAEFPSPGAPIAPADQVLVNRVGLHFFVQAMAENHGLTEDWVRRVYNERRDLPGTDRVLSKIRAAAERALDEALEREKGIIDMNGNKHVSDTERLPVKRRSRHSLGARSHVDDFREREIDSSLLHDQSASNSRQRHVLLYTPAEADKTLARARERYVPPSASRAAKYMRKRMRESSGMSSPLKPSVDAEVELKVRDDSGDDDDDNDKEEEEVSMSLTRPQALADVFRNIGGAGAAQGTPTPASAPVMNGSNLKIQRPLDILQRPTGLYKSSSWTAEEDALLSRGEDNPEMRAIIEKRGQAAIKQRAIELLMRDDDLFS
ncbi:hypothetical protein DFH11DRAFT_256720 [Phellopilus nigrolimitatus]|nr:hypothetical protein DFH11DRAFT_256720 [Phellopilus nigrolimitatus]